jgi:hypothetical protein
MHLGQVTSRFRPEGCQSKGRREGGTALPSSFYQSLCLSSFLHVDYLHSPAHIALVLFVRASRLDRQPAGNNRRSARTGNKVKYNGETSKKLYDIHNEDVDYQVSGSISDSTPACQLGNRTPVAVRGRAGFDSPPERSFFLFSYFWPLSNTVALQRTNVLHLRMASTLVC